MIETGWKYKDQESTSLGTKILKIFSPLIKMSHHYRLEDNDPVSLVFKFYLPIIKHDPKYGYRFLPRLLAFSEKYGARIRIYVDENMICAEVTLARTKVSI